MRQTKPFKHRLVEDTFKLESTDTPSGRYYVLPDGSKMPSVTTVLGWQKKDSLKQWRKRVGEEEANRISKYAANRGTKVHAVCENYLNNKPDYLDNADILTQDMFSSIQPILNERVDNIYGIESALYSNHLGLAGRCDCIADFDARPSIIDFKTSTRLKKKEWIEDYFMQTACYAVMFEERTNIPIPNLVIIIAVENESPQIFVEKRDTWIGEAIDVIAGYNAAQWLAGEDID